MASVYLETAGSDRPPALTGVFQLSRVPGIGEIVQVPDDQSSENQTLWFKVLSVVHSDRNRDHADVDAELFGVILSDQERHSVWVGRAASDRQHSGEGEIA